MLQSKPTKHSSPLEKMASEHGTATANTLFLLRGNNIILHLAALSFSSPTARSENDELQGFQQEARLQFISAFVALSVW